MKTEKFMMILLVLLISMSISLGVVSAGAIDDSSVYSANNSDLAAISVVSVDSSISDNGTLQSDVSSLNEAKNYYVSDLDGDDANDGLSKETAVKTIAKAYNLSEDGSIINIGSGVYYSTSSVAVDKSISFIGDGDVVLNKSGASIFTVPSGSTANVLFKNLTFINEVAGSGNPLLNIGGGISTISDCNFTNICAGKNGMIKFFSSAIGLVENCVFSDSNSTGASNSYIYLLGNSEVDISKSKFINLTHNGYLRSIIYVYAENATLNVNDVLFDGISGDMYGIVENKGQANLYNVTISNSVLSGSYTNSLITSSETNAAKASSTLVNHTLFINNSAVADVSSKACPMNVEYSSFLDNNKAIMNNEATVSANYNWYGTNKKENINVENVTINNWALLTVEPVSIEAHVGDKISISAEILSYEDNEGNVNELAESIPVYASFSAVSGEFDSEESLGDSEADSEYTATVEGNDVITVSSGSESFEIPVTVTASSDIVITDDNYADYFDLANNGTIVDGCGIVDGTTVYISNVTNKVFTFDKSVNVVGLEGDKISNGYIHLVAGASGSNITGVTIINDVISISTGNGTVSLHGIWLTSVENCTISNNFVQTSAERNVFAMPFTNASYNVIANNTIMGGASTCMPMGASSYNIITDNYLSSVGANIIYYNPFGHADYSSSKYPGANNYNVISNNVLNGTNGTMSSWCYAIQLMTGNYATIVNNTVTNAFLGISLPGGANSTVRGNKLSNIGSIAITVASVGVEIVDNVIDVNKTGISISKDGLTVSGNKINTNGVGINITKGGNVTIVENNVTTTGAYAIDLMSTSGNIVTDNYLVATDLTGDKAVKTTGENIITGNIPVPGPKVYNLTNETFFNYFDSDGILLSNIKVNDTLNFIGEFSDLPGVNAITISNSIVMNGVDAILKDIAIQTTGTLTGGLVINNFTIINTGVNAGMLIYDSNVTISNNTIIVVSDGTTDATALSAYVANNLVLVDNSVEFNASDKSKTNNAVVIDLSNDVLVSGNEFIVNVPSADIDWSQYPLTIVKSAGLVFTSCDDLIFTGNDVLVSNSTEGSGYNTIYGVNVKGGSDVEISNNTIMTTGHYAYSLVVAGYMDDEYNSYPVEDFTVSDNIIIAEGGAYACGLNLEGPANGNVTSNNISAKATSVAYPVYGSGMSGVLAVDYSNNTIYGFANSVYGMELMGRAETVIDNNITVEGNFTIGIASTSGTSSSGIVIKRNNINTKGEGKGTPTTGDSISSENVGIKIVKYGGNKFGTIEGNNITSTGSYAINLETTSGSVVSDNYLVGANFTGDDAVAGTGVNTIENNTPVIGIVTNDTFFNFFDGTGTLKDDVSTNLIFKGEFANLTGSILHIVINKPVSIVCEDVVLRDIGIHLVEGSSGSNLTGFSIVSNKTSNGIWLSDSNYNHITNCSINLIGSGKYAMPLIRSSYNVIDSCNIYENGGSVLVLCYANNNNITNCDIKSASSNVVYINCYDILDFKSGVNGTDYGYNNSFVNNNVSGVATAFCIGFQIMGSDNKFINNTVKGTSSAFSVPAPNKWANYTNTGNYFEGNTIVNCSNGILLNTVGNSAINNTVVNSGSGVSASVSAVIVGNNITSNGTNVGIKLTGSDMIVENNTIFTASGVGISSTKDNNTITGNNISTGADYAITLGSGSSNIVVDNYLVAKYLKGNLAVSGTGVNTIENNTPVIGIVTNDTFFNFFDENGILKDDVPTDLIFQGEFANLNGNISHIVVNRPVSIKGDKAVLNNMTMQFIDGANGSVVDNLTFINYINSYALVDLENVTDVIISNNNFTSYGNSSRCVLLNNATGCEVLNNEMFMNSSAYNSRAVLIGGNSSFNNISSNNIKVADFNGVDINPYVGGGHDNLVFNNTITSIADNVSSWNYAIQLGGPNNTAMNNTIYNVYMGIFSATGGYESIIVGNHITNLTGSFMSGAGGNAGGLAISAGISNIIENNTIVDEDVINGGINAGINSVVSGNIINVNILDNNGINAGNGSVVKNNSVTCNFTNKQMINAMYDIIIANNTIISSNGTGIFIQATSSGNFVIEGNVINITNGNSPVVNIKCSNATIKDNNISVASGVGINSIKDNNTITGNNISTGADYAITLGSGSSNIVVDNYLVAKYLKGNLAVSGTGVNTIENNTPVIGIVTNDTFFNFFDENGILKDDVPTDLIFQGEFEGLPGIVAIIISKSVVMNGIDAVLKNISIMTSANLTDGLLINNFTIINDINNAGIVIVDSNVIVSNNTIKVNSDGTTNANAICAYAANNLTLTNNIVEFTAKNSEFINSLLLIEDSANVLVDGNDFIADVPSANIDWYETPALVKSTGLMFSSCDNLTLTNNDIAVANSTVGVGYNTIYGVYSRGGSDNTIANNTINTRGHYAYSLIVGGTSYYDDEEEEFVVKEAKNAIVENNEIIANGGTYACGLKLEGPANVNVSSNNIAASATDVSYPVYSEGYNGALYADYVNNTIYGKASSVYGMELMGLGETVLDNNITVEGNFTMGIGSTSGSSSSGVVIKRNNIVVKGEGKGTPTTGDMIPAENVGIKVISDGSNKFALIEDNNISSTGKYAVNLSSTSGSTVINNYLVANPTIGDYAVYGTGVNTVKNNTPTYTGIIYVSPDGDDLNMGSEDAPVATIAKAIELATVEGGSNHIILAEGTYNENNLDVSETNLAIEGAGIDKTIIDASGKDGEIFNSYLSNLELSNLTLANAVNSDMSGGAVLSMGNLTLDTVKIINCTADENNGGAIYAVGSVEIINSIIANNTGKTGGAIYLDSSAVVGSDSSLVIKDSVFENNTAEGTAYGGGAIYMQKVDGEKSIENTSFVNNTAVAGGAIFMQQSAGDFDIIDSSFINNTANGPSANYGGGALNLIGSSYSTVGNVNVDNCVFENNTASNTTRGGGAVLDRNVDLTINNSVLLNNNDANNTSVYKDTTSYSSGGKVSLTNDWWGTNNPENLTNTKVDSWVVMSIYGPTNVTFGDDINMSVALDKLNDGSDYTGVLPADYETTLAVNGSKLMNITIPKGESVAFELTVDKTGDYVVSAINPITCVEEVNKTVTVNPKEVPIDVTVDDVSYGDNITGSIGTPINGTVSVIINDTVYNGTVEDGNFNIDASNLTVGNYSDVPMHVVSDDGTIVANANINITINKLGVVIVVKNASGTTTQNITVVVNVTDVNGKPLDGITLNYTVSNSNVTGTVEVVNGTVAKIVLIPVAGNYVVNVSFEGNENYANASAHGIVKVTKTATKFVSASSGAVYNGNYYKVTLKDASGKVLASKEVQIKLLGKVYNVTTNANGVAKVKIAATNAQIGKSLNVIYKFAGDSTYSASSGSSTIKVVKTPTVITKVTTGAVKNHGYFYVKLTTKAGKALANKVITMKSANTGKTYKLKTNANGIAKTDLWVKVKPLGKYYSYTFSYAGSSYYKPCSATFKVKIV